MDIDRLVRDVYPGNNTNDNSSKFAKATELVQSWARNGQPFDETAVKTELGALGITPQMPVYEAMLDQLRQLYKLL